MLSPPDKSLEAREGAGDAAEVESLYLTACMHLGRAHELDGSSAAALNNWGASLSKFARRKGRDEALPLLQESILKHRSCAALEPSNAEYTCNLADTVVELAALLAGPDSDVLYEEAYGIWNQVLQQLQGAANLTDRCDATVNYGNALAAHAARLSDEGNRCFVFVCVSVCGCVGVCVYACVNVRACVRACGVGLGFDVGVGVDYGCRVAAMQGFLAAEQQLAVVVSLRPNAIDARINLADVIRQAAE